MAQRLSISFAARAVVAIGQPFVERDEVYSDAGVARDEISSLRPPVEPLVLRVSATGGSPEEQWPVVGDWLCLADGSEPRRVRPPMWKYNHEAESWSWRRTWLDAWETCEDARWMLHAAGRVDPKLLTLAACACAREALQLARTGDARPRAAIEVAEAWAIRGDATADCAGAAQRLEDAVEEAHEAGDYNAAYAAQAARRAAACAASGRRGGGFSGQEAALCAEAVSEAFVLLRGVDAARPAGGLDAVARYADAVRREWRLKLAGVVRRSVPTVAVLGAASA